MQLHGDLVEQVKSKVVGNKMTILQNMDSTALYSRRVEVRTSLAISISHQRTGAGYVACWYINQQDERGGTVVYCKVGGVASMKALRALEGSEG